MKKLAIWGCLALLCLASAFPVGHALDQNRMPLSSIAGATANQIASNDGTKGAWANVASLLTAGTNVSITGTTNATISVASAAPSGSASGDLSGSYPGPTVAKLQGVSVPSPSGSNNYLLYNGSALSWAAGTLPAGVTSPGTGQLTMVPAASTALTINPSANSLTWFGGTAHSSSDFPTWINFNDSSGNPNLQIGLTSSGVVDEYLLNKTGVTGAATTPTIYMGTNAFQTLGNGTGALNFIDLSGGTAYTGARIVAGVTENHSATGLGTNLRFFTDATGTTTDTNWWTMTSQGSFVANASGSAIATSAADGFVYFGNMAGIPTGAASAFGGATPLTYDSTDNVFFGYNGSTWQDTTGGVVTGAAAAYTIKTTDHYIPLVSASPGTAYTVKLPSSSTCIGHEFVLVVSHSMAVSTTITIAAPTGDTLYLGTVSGSVTIGNAAGTTYKLCVRVLAAASGVWQITQAQ